MAASIHELFAGRTETMGDKPKTEMAYVVLEAANETEVRDLALAQIPLFYMGLPRTTVTLEERLNATTWKVVATYSAPDAQNQENPEPTFSFDTGGGTQHITQSIETVGAYGPAASDALGGAIGYDGQNVTGVDITVPVYQFAETHYFIPGFITQNYKLGLMATTGTVNAVPFRGFDVGEVIFLGASGTRKGLLPTDPWEISFKFAAQKNQVNLEVGNITGIAKNGWEYLWVQYGDDVDPTAKVLIKKPIAVYVERVYPDGDFSWLGIGA